MRLGTTATAILAEISKADKAICGADIREAAPHIPEGSIYTTLNNLERRKLIKRESRKDSIGSGRRRVDFTITAAGLDVLNKNVLALQQIATAVSAAAGGK